MKKLIMILLCLMLVLPLNAYAEGTGSQDPADPPSQQTGEQNPEQPEIQPPQQTEGQNPGQTEPQPPQQTESQNPEQPESQPPQQTEGQNPTQPETQPSDHTHTWDVSYTVPATCKEEGATAYGCSACGAIRVEVLPKLTTHTYDNDCDPHCNVCDINREVTHKFGTQWTRNFSGHWHACTVCGEQADFGKHFAGPAATEEKAQLCLTCGYTLTAKLGHSHKYETQWTGDETGHWYACSGCDDRKDFAAHSYDNGCDADCNICGYTTSTAHSYSGTWLSDETGHWDVCTICQKQSEAEPHIPGSSTTKAEAQACAVCGFALASATEPTEHLHEGEGDWLTDAQSHWQTCSCGEETEKEPHNWDAGEEQEDTTVLYTCTDCGFTRTEGEPKTGSSPLIWIGAAVAALLAAAAVIAFLVIPKLGKSGKYRK